MTNQGPARLTAADLDPLRIRLADYLERTGTELKKQGTRYLGRCPGHEDANPSFAVYGSRFSVCGCYPCGFTGDVFAVAKWLGRASNFRDAVRHVAEVLGERIPEGEPVETYVRPLPKARQPEPLVFDADMIHRSRLEWSDLFHSDDPRAQIAMDSLGLPSEAFRWASWGKSGLGWAKPAYGAAWLCYAYPTGLKWRNPDPHAKPRFQWLTGKATVPWRSEWIRPETATVYLTEGESDCLALVAAGLESDPGKACVAIPGAEGFKPEWAAIFDGKRAVLCFDFDRKGREATAKVAAMLKRHAAEILTWKGPAHHV
jgi:hypothetical protein